MENIDKLLDKLEDMWGDFFTRIRNAKSSLEGDKIRDDFLGIKGELRNYTILIPNFPNEIQKRLHLFAKKYKAVFTQALDDYYRKIEEARTIADIEKARISSLGRKGYLTEELRSIPNYEPKDRPEVGQGGNLLKQAFEKETAIKLRELENAELDAKAAEFFDATIPGTRRPCGTLHPIAQTMRQVEDIATSMGFLVLDGPEAESEYYNFEAVNIPRHHPARDTMATFWLTDGNLLRTHTSSVQVRALEKYGAPLSCIVPGRVFRYEVSDASHENTFFQVEGLMVDEGISIAHLIAVMKELISGIFGRDVKMRLRPGYFPFVEPGFEMDIGCLVCSGSGCSVCKRTGWVELVGAGLVHPNVLKAGNIDTEKYSGFAFGFGLDRLVMMRYGIEDIRLFLGGDLRFLEQF